MASNIFMRNALRSRSFSACRTASTMRVLAKSKAEEGLWMETAPIPQPGHNEVQIKMKKTAICGTDVSIWKWGPWAQETIPVGMTVGHEYVGVISDMGAGAKERGMKIGQRVTGEGHIVCGICRNCRAGRQHMCRNTSGIGVNRAGAFAEFMCLPSENVFPLPDSVTDTEASFFDAFGNAVHTALQFDCVGEDVLVTGAGPIGIMGAMVAKQAGARKVVITDVSEYRLNLARTIPAITRVVDVSKENLRDVTFGELQLKEGYDVGLEMSGNEAGFVDMVKLMNNGGRISLLGLVPNTTQLPWNEIIFKMLTIKGIYGREMYETWYKMVTLIEGGLDLSPIVTHEFKVDKFEEGFKHAVAGTSGKVILDWDP